MTLHSLTRVRTFGIWSVVAIAVWTVPLSAAVIEWPTIPRVRANGDALIAALLLEAPRRSATFRRLVDAIDASDGIVYVERGTCLHGVQACLVMSVRSFRSTPNLADCRGCPKRP